MSLTIPTLREGKRGCGYRKPGGLYLVSGKPSEPCDELPVELRVCPTCGEGVKPARGWTWVDADALLDLPKHRDEDVTAVGSHAFVCPLATKLGRCGLIWIGEGFYSTPAEFMREALAMGISRRISGVPRDFECGRDWVLLAHRSCWPDACAIEGCDCTKLDGSMSDPVCTRCQHEPTDHAPRAGVFTLFRPERVEYVVRDDDTDEQLQKLVDRGISPVRVERIDEQQQLGSGDDE